MQIWTQFYGRILTKVQSKRDLPKFLEIRSITALLKYPSQQHCIEMNRLSTPHSFSGKFQAQSR